MIYTLYLNSLQADIKNSGTASCTWYVNWDNFFERKNYEYRRCRIRFVMDQMELENTLTPADDGWQYHYRMGYLGSSFQSTRQGTSNGSNVAGSILGPIRPEPIVSWTADGTNSNINNWCIVKGNTMSSTKGPEFITPVGTSILTLQLLKFALNANEQPSLFSDFSNPWQVVIEIELMEEDD